MEYKTFVVDGAYHEYTSPQMRNAAICKDVDTRIAALCAEGWGLRAVWTVKGSVFLTMWRDN